MESGKHLQVGLLLNQMAEWVYTLLYVSLNCAKWFNSTHRRARACATFTRCSFRQFPSVDISIVDNRIYSDAANA